MGLLNSISRFFSNLFGLASGAIDEASDSMSSGSPGAIKAHYRRTKEEWRRNYNEMRDAVSQLMVLREQKKNEMEKLDAEEQDIVLKMEGALNEAEKDPSNTAHSEAYEKFFNRKTEIDARQEQLEQEIKDSEAKLQEFKQRLVNFQSEIKKLDQEESETIADIISSQKIIDLNDRINNLSTDNIGQSLASIRERRSKLKAKAKLSSELAGTDLNQIEEKYKESGKTNAASEAFAKALAARKLSNEDTQVQSKEENDTRKL